MKNPSAYELFQSSSNSTIAPSNYYTSKRKTLSSNQNSTNYFRRTGSCQNIHSSPSFNNVCPLQDNSTYIINSNRTIIEQPQQQDINPLNRSIRNNAEESHNNSILTNSFRFNNPNTNFQRINELENELQKANELIDSLKCQNQNLLSQRDNSLNQLNNINDNDNENIKKEQIKQLEDELALSKSKRDMSDAKILQISNENSKMANEIQNMNELLFEKDKNVEQTQLELQHAKKNMGDIINHLQNEIETNKLKFTQQRQELQYSNKILNEKAIQLQHDLADERYKNDNLEKKLKHDLMIEKNSKNVLKCLFEFFNNSRTMLDKNAPKLSLQEILEESDPDIFKQQVKILQERIKNTNDSNNLKFGKCFDSSYNNRIKYFQKKKK